MMNMNARPIFTIALVLLIFACQGNSFQADEVQIARLLADQASRAKGVSLIVSLPRAVPILLTWADHPPSNVSQYELYIGMCDAFAKLRAKEAIPF